MNRKFTLQLSRMLGVFMVVMIGAAACSNPVAASEGAPPANCVFIVGDTKGGDDGDVHDVIYPNDDNYTVGNGEDSWFVNCNARNFLINDGSEFYLDDIPIGDIHKPLLITTPSGVSFYITGGAYWTLNQNRAAMEEFWSICLKYNCASPEAYDPSAQDQNFATVGWSGFLAENFTYSILGAANKGAAFVSDDIWNLRSQEQIDILEDKISELFAAELRTSLGFQNDIICGSNTSAWQDPNNPGDEGNEFICTPIRFEIHSVTVAPDEQQTPAGLAVLNQLRHDNAEILYGDSTDEVLGNLDLIDACAQSGANCTVVIGDTGSVNVPASNSEDNAEPVPTEEATEPEG